jgi:hypothetical protein
MHGGAKGSGAPSGNRNALKHGAYTGEALRERTELLRLIQESEELLLSLGVDDIRRSKEPFEQTRGLRDDQEKNPTGQTEKHRVD